MATRLPGSFRPVLQNLTKLAPAAKPASRPAPQGTGYSMTDSFAPASTGSGGASNPSVTASGGTTTVSAKKTTGDSTTTTSVSSGSGNITVKRKTEEGGGGQETSLTVNQNGATVSVSETGSNGVGGKASVGVNKDGGSASVGLTFPKGLGVTVTTKVTDTRDVQSEDGYTTATTTSSVSVSVDGKVAGGVGSAGAGRSWTEQTTSQVILKDEDWARLERNEIPQPNLYEPTSIPVGGSVMMDSSSETGTRIEASYRNVLKTESNVTETRGVSTKVDRVSETTVRVTVGPTDAIENEFKASIGVGPVSVGVGASKTSSDSRLKTAEFDLSTPEGRAAYDQFLLDGTMPTENGPGVSSVAEVQVLHGTQSLSVNGSLGPMAGTSTVDKNEATVTITTPVDGPKTVVTEATYGDTSVRIEQSFDGDVEDRSKFKATLTFNNMSESEAMLFYTAITGDPNAAQAVSRASDGSITITFNAEQVEQGQARARNIAVPPYGDEVSGNPMLVDAIAYAASPYYVVIGLAGGTIILDNGGIATPGNANIGSTLLYIARNGGTSMPTPVFSSDEQP